MWILLVSVSCCIFTSVREGTFFLGGGGLGPQRGGSNSESEHQKGKAIPHVSYSREGQTSFPEFFMIIFVMLLSIFLTD